MAKTARDNKKDLEFFSSSLKIYMEIERISQAGLASVCGVSYNLVNGWLKGRSLPTYSDLRTLHSVGMDSELIFGETDEQKKRVLEDLKNRDDLPEDFGEFIHIEYIGSLSTKSIMENDKLSKETKRTMLIEKISEIIENLKTVNAALELLEKKDA